MLSYEKLGKKICIIGPSSSGKSTLAKALAKKMGTNAFHLDAIAHIENTNWQRKPDDCFLEEHKKIIDNETWVIDGLYSICMPERFAKADSIIWLDMNCFPCLWRYLKRSLANDSNRAGNLKGASNQLSWTLIKYMLFKYPKNKQRYQTFLKASSCQILKITSMKELKKYYAFWDI